MLYRHNLKIICLFIFITLVNVLSAEKVLLINKILINGLEKSETEDALRSLNLAPNEVYSPDTNTIIKERLQTYLRSRGFYFAKISLDDIVPSGENKVTLIYIIEQIVSNQISEIEFSGNRYFSKDKLEQLLDLKGKTSIPLNQIELLIEKIVDLYSSRGYLFVQVKPDVSVTDDNKINMCLIIDEGSLFRPQNYLFKGNTVTGSSTLLRISGLSQIRTFSPEILEQAENKLLNKEYITKVKILPVDNSTLSIDITEGNMTKAEGVLGIRTVPGSDKSELNGFGRIRFLNLWGTDRAISLYWKSMRASNRVIELAYHESGLNAYPFTGDVIFHRSQQDSAWIRIKADFSIFYSFQYHQLGLSFLTETLYPDTPDTTIAVKTKYQSPALIWKFDKTDFNPNPSKGNQIRIKSGWLFKQAGNKKSSIPVNEIDAVTYIPAIGRIVCSVGLHFREISDHTVKPYEQYKLGGFNSLRGYNEETFSSWRIGWINSEIRYLLTRDSRLFFLLDNGFLQVEDSKLKTDLMGLGTGISFRTRVGMISISYALSITEGRLADINSGMLHMGIASSF